MRSMAAAPQPKKKKKAGGKTPFASLQKQNKAMDGTACV